tara:strand:- start:2548 stop:2985 length:438 start_codon:yes stop_codon:yes gene_type:complete
MSHKGHTGTKGEKGVKVGFVASCFDLLHAGHCLMLKDAKSQCDRLVAALHVDPSRERIDKNTPIQSLEERLIQLQSIKYVDEILTYENERGLIDLLKKVRPNVRILGSDYMGQHFTGKNLGIPIFYHIRSHEWSSSNLRSRIKNA